MADEYQLAVASGMMDTLTARLRGMIRNGGFDNQSAIWLANAWMKVGMTLRGASFHRQAAAYSVMKREPAAVSGKRSQALLAALEAFERMLNYHKTTEGDHFNRADNAMRDFIWEYRKQTGLQPGKPSGKEFVQWLTRLKETPPADLSKEMAAGMERRL